MDLDWERSRYAWVVMGVLAVATVGFVLYSFVGTVVFGVFVYYASRPIYRRLGKRLGNRAVAASLSLVVVVLPVLLLLGYTAAIGLQEFSQLSDRVDLGALEGILAPYLDLAAVVEDPASLLRDPSVTDALRPFLDTLLASLGTVGNVLLHGFVVFALAYYLLKDGPRLRRWFERRFADENGVLTAYLSATDRDLSRVFSGNIANALFTAVLGALTYNLFNAFAPVGAQVPFPTLVGFLAGAASLVPVVGMKLVYVPVVGYLAGVQYFTADPVWWPVVAFFALSFVVVDTIPDLVIRPLISGGSLPSAHVNRQFPFLHLSLDGDGSLHVGLIMFSYIFGPILFGWYGLFLGPMLLVGITHFASLVLTELLRGVPIRPAAVDPGSLVGETPEATRPAVVDESPGDAAEPPSPPGTDPSADD
jgi:predicted PurR-regulated permease PerM